MPERPKRCCGAAGPPAPAPPRRRARRIEALLTGAFPDPVAIDLPGGAHPVFPARAQGAARRGRARRHRQGRGRRSRRDPRRAGDRRVAPGAARQRHPVPRRAGSRHGDLGRDWRCAVGEPAINPGPRAMIAAALETLEPAPDRRRDAVDPGRRGAGGEDDERPSRHRRRPVDPRHHRHRRALFLLGLDRLDRARHRRGARGGPHAYRGGDGPHIRGGGAADFYDLPELALIDMGDFVGGVLKYLRRHPVPRLTLAGGFAKMAKLAEGHLDLHSARSRIDGADARTTARARGRARRRDRRLRPCRERGRGVRGARCRVGQARSLPASPQDACAVALARLGAGHRGRCRGVRPARRPARP